MTCTTCGRHTITHDGHCPGCGGRRFQKTSSLAGFWHLFGPAAKPKRYSRSYDYSRRPHPSGFFSGRWPFKLALFPFWLARKLVRLIF